MVPSHVAIIMDGNGRWAQEHGLPRIEGHKAGVKTLKKITESAGEMGISCLTVYAFSTENWKRPRPEVEFLMKLFRQTLSNEIDELARNDIRVNIIGRRQGLSKGILKSIQEIEKRTAENSKMNLNIAFNYGGRAEIIDSIRKIFSEKDENFKFDDLNEKEFNKYLYDAAFTEVELLIRTGGEQRLSNFLLWQSAYAELFFTDKYWPEFTGQDLKKAVSIFQARERRFGGLYKAGDDNA